MTIAKSLRQRIEDNVHIEPNSYCWLWLGCVGNRYGMMATPTGRKAGKARRVHRVAWEVYRGPIPHGLHVLHRCDVPTCCNPDHLWLGTHVDNMRDRDIKRRLPTQRMTLCKRGHPLVKKPYMRGRSCSICRNASAVRRRARAKQ